MEGNGKQLKISGPGTGAIKKNVTSATSSSSSSSSSSAQDSPAELERRRALALSMLAPLPEDTGPTKPPATATSGPGNSMETYDQFMKRHMTKAGESFTHTRIPDKTLGIVGGAFNIPPEDMSAFWTKYYNHIFVNNRQEFLTEKQLPDEGPCMVDFDFRYDVTIESRQHTKDHVLDMIQLYIDEMDKLLDVKSNVAIPIYIMEKSDVNMLDDVTKDGIHMMIGIQVDRVIQIMVRNRMLKLLPETWQDLPIKNTWPEVLDEGITRGHTNWQLYGSRKPGHLSYMLKYYFHMVKDESGEWECREQPIASFDLKKNLKMLSVTYTSYPQFAMKNFDTNPELKAEYELAKSQKGRKRETSGIATGKKMRVVQRNATIDIESIETMEQLDHGIEMLFDTLDVKEFEIKETHNYVMCLNAEYYEPYDKWIRVGLALHNTNDKLFMTWMRFSAKSAKFRFEDIPKHFVTWNSFIQDQNGLTRRSIMYWAKNNSPQEFNKIRQQTIQFYIDQTICNQTANDDATEVDLAVVLFNIFKDRFVCASIKDNLWYEYAKHRWIECDQGNSLRMLISKEMHDIYSKKHKEVMDFTTSLDPSSEQYISLRKQSKRIISICTRLKTTAVKNNIMREVRELFYDKDFFETIDTNPYLMCFNNGVVDFKEKVFRRGQPDDNITKCTNIDYVPMGVGMNREHHESVINEFMGKLFPVPDLLKYMWDHLASILIGKNKDQTFNIYTGTGSNGKSLLVEVLSKMLGDYKATVPITLITQKRNAIGGTSSEVAQLAGVRYAVMQEPSKGDRINEGIMKELTGGDPIQARALFKQSITFVPQFKLVVCTNTLFDIKSNDDGTWRRIRVCDFMSKFADADKLDPSLPYQFLVDRELGEKLQGSLHVFMSMLVNRAFQTNGLVSDVDIVKVSSNKYRNSQDYLAEFINEKVRQGSDNKLRKTEVYEEFKKWYTIQYGGKSVPKGTELYDYMEKRFGKPTQQGWKNLRLVYETMHDEDGNENDEDDYE